MPVLREMTVASARLVRGRIHFQLASLAVSSKDPARARDQLALALAFCKAIGRCRRRDCRGGSSEDDPENEVIVRPYAFFE
jgi:hypothetical protein